MSNEQKLGWALGALVVGLALGWLTFRHTLPVVITAAPVTTTQAVLATKPAPLPKKAAAPQKVPTNEARLLAIESELADLPDEDPAVVTALARTVQNKRAEVEMLREQLTSSDRQLAAAEFSPNPLDDEQSFVSLQAEVAELQRQLGDARESVRDQQTEIQWIAASNDNVKMGAMYGELKRRRGIVNAIEREIEDLYASQESDLAGEAAQRNARQASLRNERNAITGQYNEAVNDLREANRAYQRALSEFAEIRKEANTLRAEKATLEK